MASLRAARLLFSSRGGSGLRRAYISRFGFRACATSLFGNSNDNSAEQVTGVNRGCKTSGIDGPSRGDIPDRMSSSSSKPEIAGVFESAPKATSKPDFPIAELELRVGRFLEVEDHPEADKMWVEKIDIGEEQGPRQIVSGIKPYYTREELLNQNCIVVANLSPAKLRNIISNGMILCAGSEDRSTVKLVRPPEEARVGDVVSVETPERDVSCTGMGIVKASKKNSAWRRVCDDLLTDENGYARWRGMLFRVGGRPLSSDLKNSRIS